MKPGGQDLAPEHGIDQLLNGWRAFGEGWVLLDMLVVLVLALVLGAVIAYHPATRRRMSSLEHFEQPKTFLTYSMVAAIVALIVEVQPAMAFVIFGIGGLLRFRTMVGDAKDTGRVIMVTVIGLCCGLKIYIVAIPATVIGWVLVWILERERAGIVKVSGVAEAVVHQSVKAYREAIIRMGCGIIGEQNKFVRREFLFVVKAPPALARETLQAELDGLPAELRGVVEFEQL
ncbi:MAG: hypothetical protein IPH44_22020 [Myxococcales bacterium]|nr:hypothetical protein [Myxococcales bacterium]MBK7192040.1 hypothetical protein [Myxococcales bacterium]MBP6846585.1 hypothetical protein [Kofleriaceae bacterium]